MSDAKRKGMVCIPASFREPDDHQFAYLDVKAQEKAEQLGGRIVRYLGALDEWLPYGWYLHRWEIEEIQ